MKLSLEEFHKKYFSNLYKLHPYQIDFLRFIEKNNEPINIQNIVLKQRQYNLCLVHMLHLQWELLNNRSVLDLFLSLFFKFETNDEGEIELIIDEYSQSSARIVRGITELDEEGNIIKAKILFKTNEEAKDFTQELKKALEVIKGIT